NVKRSTSNLLGPLHQPEVVPLDLDALEHSLGEIARDVESVAVAFLHSHRRPHHEEAVAARLGAMGVPFVSIGSTLSPTEGYLARVRTAVVDAYLQPVIRRYLDRISASIGGRQLRVMTSAGGLVGASSYRAKDSLLSGPAGGVVGAATAARRLDYRQIVAFDMGGTSTDVSRFDGDFEYRFEHRVGDADVAAPSLAIETVAAGGGSICRLEGRQLKVGPQSAGASPGPACYGAGGPLTITDVNLLLGRLDAGRFGIPLDAGAAEARLAEQMGHLAAAGSRLDRDELLLGYLAIADQRMAEAVRQISVRLGYDPRGYALVAFGGAGGQHACSVAEQLGMGTVVLPPEAGLLSAFGLGAAVLERFATRQVLRRLDEVEPEIGKWLDELGRAARRQLEGEGVAPAASEIRRRLCFLRLVGQESSLEIEAKPDVPLEEAFLDAYAGRYGYRPRAAAIEVVSLRVVASERRPEQEPVATPSSRPVEPEEKTEVVFADGRHRAGVFALGELGEGAVIEGPCLVFDRHASLTVPPGWTAQVRGGALVASGPASSGPASSGSSRRRG
ncbi:MAG: hydantoinase/oxoprolinase family protein, partial [Acidobacteriota bacterium]